MVGRTISHYRVVGQLGSGGMGVVYRAEDLRLGRSVALKFVSEDLAHDPQAIQRLRSEARAASSLNHANICTIYDIDEHDGHPFIVMELMKGRSLRDSLADGPLKVHQLVDIGIETADALHAAHSEHIIHRDIKPGNIFLTERGHVKILDFGLAKLTSDVASDTTREADRTGTGVTLGTVSYMSPEQATGEPLDGRTDLFSLGVVLYECATGRHPFQGKTTAVILASILNRAPVAPVILNPELPVRLQDVINNCLEKDRELRYQSAADLRADLKRVRRDLESGRSRAMDAVQGVFGTSARGTARTEKPPRPVSGSLVWRAGAAVALAAAIAVAAYALWRDVRQPAPPQSHASADVDPAIASRLALAAASLEARNYRAALAYAGQVLALDDTRADARKIRADALAALARFDEAIDEARRRLAAGDLQRASEALDTARSIDPSALAVSEVASRLTELDLARRSDGNYGGKADRPKQSPAPERPRTAAPSAPGPLPSSTSAAAQPQPRSEAPVAPAAPAPTAAAISAGPAAAAPEPAVPPRSQPAGSTAADPRPRERPQTSAQAPSPEDDDTAIRSVTAAYARAIETKDLALFRSIKPNLSREEERRLQDGFRAVTSQQVDLTIVSINRRGDEASVVLRRRDTIRAGGRQQTNESRQTMTLERTAAGWKVVDIR